MTSKTMSHIASGLCSPLVLTDPAGAALAMILKFRRMLLAAGRLFNMPRIRMCSLTSAIVGAALSLTLGCSSSESNPEVPKEGGEVSVVLRQSFSFWAAPHSGMTIRFDEPELTKWSMTFRRAWTQKAHPVYFQSESPYHTHLRKAHGAQPLGWAGDDATYLVAEARITNLNNAKQYLPMTGHGIRVMTDSGEVFDGEFILQPEPKTRAPRNRWEEEQRSIDPIPMWGDVAIESNKTIQMTFWARIPEDTHPLELSGLIGGTSFGERGVVRFRLDLSATPLDKPDASSSRLE